jgi:hypothetical protein
MLLVDMIKYNKLALDASVIGIILSLSLIYKYNLFIYKNSILFFIYSYSIASVRPSIIKHQSLYAKNAKYLKPVKKIQGQRFSLRWRLNISSLLGLQSRVYGWGEKKAIFLRVLGVKVLGVYRQNGFG